MTFVMGINERARGLAPPGSLWVAGALQMSLHSPQAPLVATVEQGGGEGTFCFV